jgi:hypothetical protein
LTSWCRLDEGCHDAILVGRTKGGHCVGCELTVSAPLRRSWCKATRWTLRLDEVDTALIRILISGFIQQRVRCRARIRELALVATVLGLPGVLAPDSSTHSRLQATIGDHTGSRDQPGTSGLSGAELEVANGWFWLRSHPTPAPSISFGGRAVPEGLYGTLRSMSLGPRTF